MDRLARIRGLLRLSGDLSWNLAAQGALLVSGFATSILTARLLLPAGRGELGVVLTASNLTLVFLFAGVSPALTVVAAQTSTEELVGAISAVVGAACLIPVGLGVVALAGAFPHGFLVWEVGACLVPLTLCDWCFGNVLVGRMAFRSFAVATVAARASIFLASAVAIRSLGLGVVGGLLGSAVGEVVMITALTRALGGWHTPKFAVALNRRVASYAARAQVGSVLQLLTYRVDVVILKAFAPYSVVGVYVVAETMSEVVLAISRAFQNLTLPLVARAQRDTRGDISRSLLRRAAAASGLGVIAAASLGFPLLRVGYGSEYGGAMKPFLILLPGVFFLSVGNVAGSDLKGRGRPGLSSILSAGGLAVTSVLDFALIPSWGMNGAAVASLVGYTAYGAVSIVCVQRHAAADGRAALRAAHATAPLRASSV